MKRNDLEGGFFELHTDDGERYQLAGADADLIVEGARVEVEGKIDEGAMGFGMTGPTIAVKSMKSLESG
jgi:hypothetical protein